ncbi:MAG: NAD(P)H-dependent flavin oxidoreductase, partial [Candidatus Heimdallarchaeota archaeon]
MTSSIKTEICDLLGIKYPIIQAGMGPHNTVNLAIAVSNSGAMGTVSIPGMAMGPKNAAKKFREYLHTVKKHTKNNFAVNTPVGENVPENVYKTSEAFVRTVIEEKEKDPELNRRLKLYITSAGNPARYVKKIKDAGMLHFHVVASAYHAQKVEKLGLDGVIASGYEAGGHTHLPERTIHTFILIPQVVEAVKIPVIAAGGVCDAKTFVAALALGAKGVQIGTRFIATKESELHNNYKEFIDRAGEWSDMVIPGVYGPLRCLKNRGAEDIIKMVEASSLSEEDLAKYKDEQLLLSQKDGNMDMGLVA